MDDREIPARRIRGGKLALALIAATWLVAGSVAPAFSLGWSPAVTCANGGTVSGQSYRITFSNAGGNTAADAGCGPSAGIQLRYQAYPGSPYYVTGQSIASYYVSRVQGGTENGYHRAYSSGVLVGQTSS